MNKNTKSIFLKLVTASAVDLSTASTPVSSMELSATPLASTKPASTPSFEDNSLLATNSHDSISVNPVNDEKTTGNVSLKLKYRNE